MRLYIHPDIFFVPAPGLKIRLRWDWYPRFWTSGNYYLLYTQWRL